jgi:hypothetical protein
MDDYCNVKVADVSFSLTCDFSVLFYLCCYSLKSFVTLCSYVLLSN